MVSNICPNLYYFDHKDKFFVVTKCQVAPYENLYRNDFLFDGVSFLKQCTVIIAKYITIHVSNYAFGMPSDK